MKQNAHQPFYVCKLFTTCVLMAISTAVIAECDGQWREYQAGSLTVEVKTCNPGGNSSNINVKNPYNFSICVTTVFDGNGNKWYNTMDPGQGYNLDYSQKGIGTWQVGASKKTLSYCPR